MAFIIGIQKSFSIANKLSKWSADYADYADGEVRFVNKLRYKALGQSDVLYPRALFQIPGRSDSVERGKKPGSAWLWHCACNKSRALTFWERQASPRTLPV